MLTAADEQRIAHHMAKTPWLERVGTALRGPLSRKRIESGLRLWIAMCAEIGIDWPAECRGMGEDAIPATMDRIIQRARSATWTEVGRPSFEDRVEDDRPEVEDCEHEWRQNATDDPYYEYRQCEAGCGVIQRRIAE